MGDFACASHEDTSGEFFSSMPVLFVNEQCSMSNKIPPISDSQSTVCYDANTVLISSCDPSVDSVQVMSDMKEKKC